MPLCVLRHAQGTPNTVMHFPQANTPFTEQGNHRRTGWATKGRKDEVPPRAQTSSFSYFPRISQETFHSTRFLGAGGGGGRSDRAVAPLNIRAQKKHRK